MLNRSSPFPTRRYVELIYFLFPCHTRRSIIVIAFVDWRMEEILKRMRRASKDTRGMVLECVTDLETVIDSYIANYFVGKDDDRFNDFKSLIITPYITFRNKAETFRILVSKLNPEFISKYPDVGKHLNDIAAQRNVLAHHSLYTTDAAIQHFHDKGELQYLKFRLLNTKMKLSYYL